MAAMTLGKLLKRRETLEEAAANVLGKTLLAFGRLEFGLGLCVRSVESAKGVDGASFASRLKALSDVVASGCQTDSATRSAYLEWIGRADAVRQFRNQMVHGRWLVDPESIEVLNVVTSPDCTEQTEIRYSLSQLEEIAKSVVELQRDLGRLQTLWPL